MKSWEVVFMSDTCKHGTAPVSHVVRTTDEYGREVVKKVEMLTCAQCKAEMLEDLTGLPCTCGEGVMVIHDEAWAKCDKCGRTCDLVELEHISKRSDKSEQWAQIRQCYLEDTRRGSRGGGSGDKGPKKEDKLGSRSLRQVTWTDEATTTLKQESVEPKDAWLSVRGIPEGVSGETVRKAIERKLGL